MIRWRSPFRNALRQAPRWFIPSKSRVDRVCYSATLTIASTPFSKSKRYKQMFAKLGLISRENPCFRSSRLFSNFSSQLSQHKESHIPIFQKYYIYMISFEYYNMFQYLRNNILFEELHVAIIQEKYSSFEGTVIIYSSTITFYPREIIIFHIIIPSLCAINMNDVRSTHKDYLDLSENGQ